VPARGFQEHRTDDIMYMSTGTGCDRSFSGRFDIGTRSREPDHPGLAASS